MNTDKIHIFTDFDLDGTISLIALTWILGLKENDYTFTSTNITNFRRDYSNWLVENKPENYKKIYILDLDVSDNRDLIDRENVTIIDHHLTHVDNISLYKNAVVQVKVDTSCAKLLYRTYKEQINIDEKKKLLIAIADDYDCYNLKLKESYELNCLLTNLQKKPGVSKYDIFISRFKDGFNGFNEQETSIIRRYVEGKNKAIADLDVYKGKIPIKGKEYTFCGTHGEKYVNEICEYLMTQYNADVAFFVNVNNSHVSFRKKKGVELDVSKIATKLCEGGGHEYAAGGKVTPDFMAFIGQLNKIV